MNWMGQFIVGLALGERSDVVEYLYRIVFMLVRIMYMKTEEVTTVKPLQYMALI